MTVGLKMMLLKVKYGRRWLIFSGMLVMLVSSCGYRFAGQGHLPGGISGVRIAVFENHTSETGVETIVTRCLIDEFVRRGVKTCGGTADAEHGVLSGSVAALQIHTISRSGQITALERRVRLTVDVTFSGINGETLWLAQGLTDSEAYDVESEKADTEQNRSAAIEEIAGRIAEVVYNRMTDDF
jgi:hypothetical protein